MRTGGFLLGVVSVVVALLLWLQVATQSEPSKQREISLPLELRNLREDLIAIRFPAAITVIAEGSAEQLDQINTKQMSAFVDLSRAKSGPHLYLVQVNAPTRLAATLSLKQPRELVEVSPVTRRDYPVTVDERGIPPQGLEYDGATAQPSTVTIVGPEAVVSQVTRVRAMIDLGKLQPGNPFEAVLEILGKNNLPLPLARSDPRTVRVFPAIASAPAKNRVLVTPNWRGQPAFGYQVEGYEIQPGQVEITGRPAVIGKIAKIDTEPIDITGVKGPRSARVNLRIPFGIKANVSSVLVKIRVIATTPAPPIPTSTTGNN